MQIATRGTVGIKQSIGLAVAGLVLLSCRPDSGASSQLNGDGSGPTDPEICLLPDDVTL